jgi:uncharacterized protein (UPF0332 family)
MKKNPTELESYYSRVLDQRFLVDYGAEDFEDLEMVKNLLSKAGDFVRHIEKLLDEK